MSKSFSDFIRNASDEEKRAVYERVITDSCDAQKRAAGIPTAANILKAYEDQPIDDRLPLAEILDNAINMTMRACWGISSR